MENGDIDVQLSIVCPGRGSIVFGPLTRGIGYISDYDFIDGSIAVVDENGVIETLDDRNGIEARALANFGDDLRQMAQAGHGVVFFGDHDFGQIVELEVMRPGVIRVMANLAALDRFDIFIGEIAIDTLDEIIDQIECIESRFGPLVGYCGGCGTPTHAYFPRPLTA